MNKLIKQAQMIIFEQSVSKRKGRNIIALLIIVISSSFSCNRSPQYSVIPYIEFDSIEWIDNSRVNLTFYFQDGDGDIGLEGDLQADTLTTDSDYNFFCKYYEKENGEYIYVETAGTLNARIPPLSYSTPESIEGTITIERFINNPLSDNNTVCLEFYIVDRAMNQSNTVRTPDIIINK